VLQVLLAQEARAARAVADKAATVILQVSLEL
jgi:hypothetical protein